MDIYVQMKMREIQNGTQIIAFYNSEIPNDKYLIDDFEYEYGGSLLDSSYGSTIGFVRKRIPMSTFESVSGEKYKLVIRYSASGLLEDDWENSEIYVNVVYHR